MEGILEVLRSISHAIVSPRYLLIIFILTFIIYRKNSKVKALEEVLYGKGGKTVLESVLSQLCLGIFAGVLASVLLYICRVTFYQESYIELLFIISMVLMFIKSRFLCFSYSGALLGLIYMLYKFITIGNPDESFNLSLANIVILVAIMHIVEGILVFIDGKSNAIPILYRGDKKIKGGFLLNRTWILPMSLILFQSIEDPFLGIGFTNTPDWIRAFGLICAFQIFYSALGYKSVTYTMTKQKKATISSMLILSYGLILLVLGLLTRGEIVYEAIVILAMPLMHEIMLYLDRLIESKSKLMYVSSKLGLKVLDVARDSIASDMGIKSGDTLININGDKISTVEELIPYFKGINNEIMLRIKNTKGKILDLSYKLIDREKPIGMVLVPRRKLEPPKEQRFSDVLNETRER